MNVLNLNTARSLLSVGIALAVTGVAGTAQAADKEWTSATIAEAVQAAPPSVTDTASIYGWTADGELVLARYGSGSYTCIGSGSFSLRVGKPALPYPDPMCLDHNAWAFIQALWSGSKPLPTEPGLIWMLAGMNVSKSAVDIGAATVAVAKDDADAAKAGIVQMTPHVMVLPLPFSEKAAAMGTAYSLDDPLNAWIMAAGKPHEHLMVHFSAEDVGAMMSPGK
ncbi:MAG: hypothetical protein KDH15_21160 [Rhodocyclaceae bacterium]|nr:hypothetical protein [Rhodocyclaceae bacterium]